MTRGKGIFRLYQTGGANLLAYRLSYLFTKIETDEQRILHNDVLADVLDIINKSYPDGKMLMQEEKALLSFVADWLLYQQFKNRRKRFLFRMAEKILHLGRAK